MFTKRKVLALYLSLAIIMTMVASISLSTVATGLEEGTLKATPEQYIDENGRTRNSPSDIITMTDETTEIGTNSTNKTQWYIVKDKVSISKRIEVLGTASIILADKCKLTAKLGIHVKEGNTLNIFAQSTGADAGMLTAGGLFLVYDAAIGGDGFDGFDGFKDNNGENCGTVAIHGGIINASTMPLVGMGAGIGGGLEGFGGTVTITGGIVTASSGTGAGIGGGLGGFGGTVTITGGTVTASSIYGAGIGGGAIETTGGSGGKVTITGGTVKASSTMGAGIGGGAFKIEEDPDEEKFLHSKEGGSGGIVTITGGTVTASSIYGAGIGGGSGETTGSGGKVTITGGTVIASSGKKQEDGSLVRESSGIGGSITGANNADITLGNGATVKKSENGESITLKQGETWGAVIAKESTIWINVVNTPKPSPCIPWIGLRWISHVLRNIVLFPFKVVCANIFYNLKLLFDFWWWLFI